MPNVVEHQKDKHPGLVLNPRLPVVTLFARSCIYQVMIIHVFSGNDRVGVNDI